jgi:hypothetical protein
MARPTKDFLERKGYFNIRIENKIQKAIGRQKLAAACYEGARAKYTEHIILERLKKHNQKVSRVSLLRVNKLSYQFYIDFMGEKFKFEAVVHPFTSEVTQLNLISECSLSEGHREHLMELAWGVLA